MLPINLEISAFGPYKDKVNIDFSVFGSSGLFLITGATGSGKTSIFDAIIYALFGEASGSNRDVLSIRSNFSSSDTKTYVILKFKHKNKLYEIYRKPAYLRPKKKGNGDINEPSDAYLKYDDVIITKVTNVNEKIEEILGINVKQFKQISMLAQGEFLKILYADSKERTEIFRKIFDTDIYNKITYKLKDIRSVKEYQLKDKTREIIIKLNEINYIDKDKDTLNEIELRDYIEKLKNEIIIKEKEDKEINNKLLKKEKEYNDLNNKINKIQEENNKILEFNKVELTLEELKKEQENINIYLKQINKNKEIIEKLNPIKTSISNILSDINENDKAIKIDNNKLKEINNKKESLEIKLKNMDKLTKYYYEYQDNLKKLLDYEDESKKIIDIDKDIKNKEELLLKEKELKNKEDTINKINIKVEEYKKYIDLNKELNDELDKVKEVLKLTEERNKLIISYDKLNKEYINISDKYNIENDKYFRNMASILGKDLKEKSPCPVCGSLEHPNICICSDKVLTKEELDILKKSLDESLKKLTNNKMEIENNKKLIEKIILKEDIDINKYFDRINTNIQNNNKLINNIKDEYLKLYKNINNKIINIELFSYDILLNENNKEKFINNTEISKIIGKIDNVNKIIYDKYKLNYEEYKNKINKDFKDNKEINNKLYNDINNIYKELENKDIDISNFNMDLYNKTINEKNLDNLNNLSKISGLLEEHIRIKNTLELKLEDINKTYFTILNELGFDNEKDLNKYILDKNTLEKLIDKCEQYKEQMISTNTKYITLKESLKSYEVISIDKFNNLLKVLNDELNNIRNISKDSYFYITKLKDKYKYLNSIYDIYIDYIKEFNSIDLLYKTASGNLLHKSRIEFEQYVQSTYFDMIIIEANKRLSEMSDFRYLLLRKEKPNKLSDKFCLELEVFDNYNGKTRDIKSLSGGESFKASLSLALGLSDVIQSYSGGIVIETMFIDEGFATLDEDARSDAINTLNNLSNNKLVGIISHVKEIKDVVNNKIIIDKTKFGSNIRVEV